MCGYVYSKEDTVIKTNRYGFESSDTVKVGAPADVKWTTDPLWYSGTTGAAVIVVDDSDEKVSAGSVNDILDYENFGSECSLVVMKYRSNVLKEVIVYNK